MNFSGIKVVFVLLWHLLFVSIYHSAYGQKGIIGDYTTGWGGGDVVNLSASSGSSLIYTKNFASTGNKYFRVTNNSDQQCSPSAGCSGGDDTQLSFTNQATNEITSWGQQNCTNGAWYANAANTGYYYIVKTYSATSTPDFIIFEVQGTVKTISSVNPTAPTVYVSQTQSVSADMSASFSTGQKAYLRYTTDNWSTNTVIAMTAGTPPTYTTATSIPAQTVGTTVKYKVFTSGTATPSGTVAQVDLKVINESAEYFYTVAAAATITSTTSGNWNTGGTWVGGVVPASTEHVVIASGHTITLDVDKTCASLTINAGGAYAGSSNTLTIASGGTLTNNNTFTSGTGTILFAGSGTISGTISFNNVTIAGAVNFGTASTITGNLTINSGGSVLTNAPTYTCPATLIINSTGTYSRATEWGAVTSGNGYPCNVQVSNSTTYDVGAGGAATTAQIAGNLIIDNSCIFTLDGSTDRTAGVTIVGNVTVGGGASGTMTLSSQSGGDLAIGGNLTRGVGSTWTNNGRAVTFNGSADQTLSYTGGGTQQFDYLTINKSAGNLVLSSSPATSMQIQSTAGNVLTINNTGGLDVNGQTFTLGCSGCMGGNVLVDGGARAITSTASGGIIRIQGNNVSAVGKTVTSANSGTLTFSTNTILALNTCQFNPGSSLTTINNEAHIESGGNFITNAPTYGTSSTLTFKNGNDFKLTVASDPQKTWVPGSSGAGVPYNVYILAIASAGTTVTAENGGSFYVRNNITIEGVSDAYQGILTLSNSNGPNTLYVGGNYIQNFKSTLNENSQKIVFYGGPSGNNAQEINSSGDADDVTFYDMQIDNDGTATVTLTSTNLVITNVLTMTDGWLVLGSNTLTLNSGASVSGVDANSWVVTDYTGGTGNTGCMKKKAIGPAPGSPAFVFPIGPSTSSYNPVTFEPSATNVSDDFSARVLIGVAPSSAGYTDAIAVSNTTEFVNRTWEMFEVTGGGTNGDLIMQWIPADENASFTRANSQAYHYTGGTWVKILSAVRGGANPYTHRAGPVTSFSPYIVGEDEPFSLPIELISFTGNAGKNGNTLEWTTASEINNDYFTLETSPDGIHFNVIGTIPGAGNSTQFLNYSFFDNETPAIESDAVIYYRLKQTDFDGTYSYSQIIALSRSAGSALKIQNLFVDADERLNVNLAGNYEHAPAKLEITDAIGRVIFSQYIKGINGLIKVNLPENYAHQILMLKVYNGHDFIVKKFYY